MTTAVLAIDPGNRYTGLACAVQDGPGMPRMVAFQGVIGLPGDVERTVDERILPALDAMVALLPPGTRTTLVFEEPPETSRSDVHHGSEARIGYAEGWLSGLIAGSWRERHRGLAPPAPRSQPPARIAVSTWRDAMIVHAGRLGLFLEAPRRSRAPGVAGVTGDGPAQRCDIAGRPGGGFARTWRGCGHVQNFASFRDLKSCADTRCPACASGPAEVIDPAAWVREEWKRIACQSAMRAWPGIYRDVVESARERARGGAQPDHQLGGVADACEAAWVAIAGLAQ